MLIKIIIATVTEAPKNLTNKNPVRNDPNKPMFFIGSSTAKDSIVFNVSAKYLNESKLKDKNITSKLIKKRITTGL